jgi:hypothetical protein
LDYYRLEIAALTMSIASLIFIVLIMGFMVYRLHVIRQGLTKLNGELELKIQGLEDLLSRNMDKLEKEISRVKVAQAGMEELTVGLKAALARITKLEGILPICGACKKIRNDEGNWQTIETYIGDHAPVKFSHGLCPDCRKDNYPEYPEPAVK